MEQGQGAPLGVGGVPEGKPPEEPGGTRAPGQKGGPQPWVSTSWSWALLCSAHPKLPVLQTAYVTGPCTQ